MATLALLFIVVMALLNSVQSSSATINLLPGAYPFRFDAIKANYDRLMMMKIIKFASDLMIDSEEFPVDQQFDSVRAFNESSYSNFRFIKMDPRMNLFIVC